MLGGGKEGDDAPSDREAPLLPSELFLVDDEAPSCSTVSRRQRFATDS
jgi:hypothetical protein